MNYLAHLRLAAPTDESRLGNLLGDFARGLDLESLPPAVKDGVRMHREIDRFTDAHPAFRRARAILAPRYSRYSGVLVDVFFDHHLSRQWDRFGAVLPLADFTASVYAMLERWDAYLPPRLRVVAPRMAAEDWLARYGEFEAIDRTLLGLSRRLSRENPLAEAGAELRRHHDRLRVLFERFFPDVIAHAAQLVG